MPMNIARESSDRQHPAGRDAAHFGGVGLPVAADGVDVLGGGDRPEAGLLGEVAEELVGAVDRAFRAHALEHLVRRTLLPQLVLGQLDAADVAFDGRH